MRTKADLIQMQSAPLEVKILMTQSRIREWVREFGTDGVYVSFSGGKDSTVLLHLVRELYPDVEAVFVNTGLEYPEIQKFVKTFDNVTILRPEMRFDEVIKKYGYPVISKEVAKCVQYAKKAIAKGVEENHGGYMRLCGLVVDKNGDKSRYNCEKYKPLLYSDFNVSSSCCNVMKKNPVKQYAKKTGKMPITAQMASESFLREQQWIKKGCNAFNSKQPISNPMSFWTEQDVLRYIKLNGIKIADVYGFVAADKDGQQALDDCGCKLCTTGCNRTGCIFCGFGAHLEKGEGKFERLKRTHPKQYDFCMNGGSYDSDGIWKPDKNGLGMKHVIDTLNSLYGDDFIKY